MLRTCTNQASNWFSPMVPAWQSRRKGCWMAEAQASACRSLSSEQHVTSGAAALCMVR